MSASLRRESVMMGLFMPDSRLSGDESRRSVVLVRAFRRFECRDMV